MSSIERINAELLGCSDALRVSGLPSPPNCKACGLGPCKFPTPEKKQDPPGVVTKSVSDLVRDMESQGDDLRALLGEVLLTLEINIKARTLMVSNIPAGGDFLRLRESWKRQAAKLGAWNQPDGPGDPDNSGPVADVERTNAPCDVHAPGTCPISCPYRSAC